MGVPAESQSFWLNRSPSGRYNFNWHFHAGYELIYFISGAGRACVGDYTGQFRAGELFLVGPNLAHSFFRAGPEPIDSIWIILTEKVWQKLAETIPETRDIAGLLRKSAHGLAFRDKAVGDLGNNLAGMAGRGLASLAELLVSLAALARMKADRLSSIPVRPANPKEISRLNDICDFLHNESCRQISLHKVAQHVHLSIPRLCAFFRQTTGKTIIEYVNEVRLGKACEQLQQTDKPITAIAMDCGFGSISNFNRRFAGIIGMTPKQFRNRFDSLSV